MRTHMYPMLGGRNSGFSPLDISGCKLWLGARFITGLSDDDPVGTWSDQSGNGNDASQSTAAKKPTYKTNIRNSLPVCRFDWDGADTFMDTSLALGNDPVTVVVALIYETVTYPGCVVCHQSSTPYKNLWVGSESSTAMRCWKGDGTNYDGLLSDAISDHRNEWQILSWVIAEDGTVDIFKDGTDIGGGSATKDVNWTVQISSDAYRGMNGDIAELLVYNSALSVGDRGQVESFLSTKYDIDVS